MGEEKRRAEPGDTVREGVRSMVGILGALKDAIEQSFEDLRGTGERPADRAPDSGPEAEPDKAESVKDTVQDLRDRFDFVSRKDLEALRQEVERLAARVRALEDVDQAGAETDAGAPGARTGGEPPEPGPEPAPERPFRIDSE